MGKIIAIVNQKGGVGKTTTAINLSTALALLDYKVLVIDGDPQANTTSGLGLNAKEFVGKNFYNLLIGETTIEQAIVPTQVPGLDIVPSHIDLAGFELEIINELSREHILKERLGRIQDNYDFVFVDCSPSLGLLVINVLTASNSVLIPVQCEYFALEGIVKLVDTINIIKKKLNPDLLYEGILASMFDARTNLSQMVRADLLAHFKNEVFETAIPKTIRLAEAPSFGLPVFFVEKTFGKTNNSLVFENAGAVAYLNLAKEILSKNNLPELKNG